MPPEVPDTGAAENGIQNPTPLPGPVPLAAHATATLVTFADPTVPDPLLIVQVCPLGWVRTLTAYGAAAAMAVVNVNAPLAVSVRLFAPLSCSVTEPLNPVTVPPMVYEAATGAVQLTAMFVTLTEATVPDPLVTVQVSPLDVAVVTA